MTRSVPDEVVMVQVRDGAVDRLGDLFDRYQVPLYNFYAKMRVSESLVVPRLRDVWRLRTEFIACLWGFGGSRAALDESHRTGVAGGRSPALS